MSGAVRVLIVDDDPALRYGYARMLRDFYEVAEAATAEECLRLAFASKPDIILLDVMLGDDNSLALCRRIKSDPGSGLPLIILISGREVSIDRQAEGLETGADGYLTKPVSERMLLAQVRAMARIRRAEVALDSGNRREMSAMSTFSDSPTTPRVPVELADLMARYAELLEKKLQSRVYKVDDQVSIELRNIAGLLSAKSVGPRAVVDIHCAVLKEKLGGANAVKSKAYLEESRLLLVELMGYLAETYRRELLTVKGTS